MNDDDGGTTDGEPLQSSQQRCLGGRYMLLDPIGAGGGAVVVRARDRQLPRKIVAVKLLRSRDEDLRRRFVQEAEVLADVAHPSIVQVLGRDSEGEEFYTVLELIDGLDLFEHLARSGPLAWRQVIDIGIQIAGALAVVHARGLVHRDVKPANIMLDASGRVKLIDFGVVRITENYRAPTGTTQRRPTEIGVTLGTPGYLPLEAGLVVPNPSFDVFGLGATLYQLLTGKIPEEPILPVREARPGCDAPADLELVLTAALALEPEDRTQTAAELGAALAAVRAAHPERGTPSPRIDGRYELIGLAGTGAKADAKMAVHRGTGHDVVLKFLRADAPEDVLRFAREAKLLSAFNHPALPRFYDYAPEASPPYIVMARAPGQPASRLCSPPRLKPAEVAAVGVKLAQVLAVLHARGVLHRDINASNVMIDAHGAVTLLDFGCAELEEKFYDVPAGERRYLTPPEGRVSIPDGGIGRLGWSAPEVRHGTAWSDRSDVYSTGHLLFRLLTGKVPRKGADPPTSPREFVITCPAEIASAIESTLRVDPQARPTAAQLAQRLLDALENEQTSGPRVQADPPSLPVPDPDPATPPAQPAPVIVTAAKVPAVKLPRRTLAWAACFCVAVLVAWWAQRPEHPVVAANSPTPPSLGRPPVSAASVSLGAASPAADMPADSATQRLADAGPALTECARKAGRKVWVDLEVSKGESHFTRINIVGDNSEGCARAVLQQLRFDPPNGAESLVKEYKP